jgi:TolB protein
MRSGPVAVALSLALCAAPALAQERLRIDVHDPGGRRLELALQRFEPDAVGAAQLRERFYNELGAALDYSGVFHRVDPAAFLEPRETLEYERESIRCDNWKGIGADGLVQGRLEQSAGTLRARFRVWDTARCRLQGDPARFEAAGDALSLLARRVADDIVYRFTGRRGVSATQIAFVSDQTGAKELYVMEADGSGKRKVTGNRSINLFPSWSPKGDSLIYTSYRAGGPDLWILSKGRRPNGKLMKVAATKYRGVWAPNDGHVAMVMNKDSNTDIYLAREDGSGLRRLTYGRSIEASPAWSPDGRRLAYVSDESGSPQIYIREIQSGEARRLTFEGSYNASPAWSPTGQWIVYAAQTSTNFDLYLIDPETGFNTPLVSHPRSDEEPAWSPDGRKVAFLSNRRGTKDIYVVDIGDPEGSLRRLTEGSGNCSNPAWSPWLP